MALFDTDPVDDFGPWDWVAITLVGLVMFAAILCALVFKK
jgi:hypothetical protein